MAHLVGTYYGDGRKVFLHVVLYIYVYTHTHTHTHTHTDTHIHTHRVTQIFQKSGHQLKIPCARKAI
jgi:hypothetical protein